MAEFCKKCNFEIFGIKASDLAVGEICEGCKIKKELPIKKKLQNHP